MREIKFRALNKIDHLLCDVVEIVFGADDSYVAVENGQYIERWRFDDVEIMQYIGKTDESGVDIYDGDVVEVDVQEYVASRYTETIYSCVVRYEEGRYYFDVIKAKTVQSDINGYVFEDAINFEDVESDDLKIIGNKFQNPELLEVSE